MKSRHQFTSFSETSDFVITIVLLKFNTLAWESNLRFNFLFFFITIENDKLKFRNKTGRSTYVTISHCVDLMCWQTNHITIMFQDIFQCSCRTSLKFRDASVQSYLSAAKSCWITTVQCLKVLFFSNTAFKHCASKMQEEVLQCYYNIGQWYKIRLFNKSLWIVCTFSLIHAAQHSHFLSRLYRTVHI